MRTAAWLRLAFGGLLAAELAWSHVASFAQPAEGNLAQAPLTALIGVMWAIAVVGFPLSLAATPTLPTTAASRDG